MIHELEIADADFPGRKLSLARVRPDEDGPAVWSLAIITAEDQWPIAVTLSMADAARVAETLSQDAQPPASPEPAPTLPLGHEYEGRGKIVPGCTRYQGGNPDDFSSYCGHSQAAHLPEPAPFATVEALKASVAEGPHTFVPKYIGAALCALCDKTESAHPSPDPTPSGEPASEREKAAVAALRAIEVWELPEHTGAFSCGGRGGQHVKGCARLCHEYSFGYEFGSNGERDHIRAVARRALSAYSPPTTEETGK